MKLWYFFLCLTLAALPACGPKEVGQGTADAVGTEHGPGPDPVVELRYPVGNNRIQQRLYVLNQPQTMDFQQERVRQSLMRTQGQEDPENKKPKQVSPFRE